MFYQFIALAVLSFLSYLLRPKPQEPSPVNLEDFNIPVADPEKEIIVVFGTGWVKDPNVVWYGDLGVQSIKRGGKK